MSRRVVRVQRKGGRAGEARTLSCTSMSGCVTKLARRSTTSSTALRTLGRSSSSQRSASSAAHDPKTFMAACRQTATMSDGSDAMRGWSR